MDWPLAVLASAAVKTKVATVHKQALVNQPADGELQNWPKATWGNGE